eukprot:228664-Rhodomonas_salina.3
MRSTASFTIAPKLLRSAVALSDMFRPASTQTIERLYVFLCGARFLGPPLAKSRALFSGCTDLVVVPV